MRDATNAMRWVWRGSALAALVIGWTFILFQNNFHLTPPTVFVCLGYFAVIAAIYTLWRVGASAVATNEEDDGGASFDRPVGPYAELEREKRALLKAIKEAEFDHEMGKLSKADADQMIAIYRTRAIEVIKELDVKNSATGTAGTVREQILREARARIALEKKDDKPNAKLSAREAKKRRAQPSGAEARNAAAVAASKAADAKAADAKAADAKAEAKGAAAKATDAPEAKPAEKAPDVVPEAQAKPAEKAPDVVPEAEAKPAEKTPEDLPVAQGKPASAAAEPEASDAKEATS